MEHARAYTSSKRLASTFDTLIESPEADITAISVIKPESQSTGNNRDIPVSVQELRTRRRSWPKERKIAQWKLPKPPQAKLHLNKCQTSPSKPQRPTKKTRINEIEIEKDDTKYKNDVSVHESDFEFSEEEELPDELSIENIYVYFEVTEVHTHLPQYSDECMDLIHVQDSEMQKNKPARGKGYTAGSSCITNIVINNRAANIHLDSGAFFTCVGIDYLDKIYTNWQDNLMPIEGIKFSSASQNMHPLGIFEAEIIFPYPTGSIRLKVEFVVMNNHTSKH
ncbi:hypothetical protein O181_110648 [Austropuccinia psidii MF-1]|uniref:Uncharacterized protein n=1 Tax=Austropuccinia psidii MF-1 TaxID=1389203 RepID=A0A9Q3PR05_9BASI|nr:hypothetical protein [Austropuccinia psidii MF-1]